MDYVSIPFPKDLYHLVLLRSAGKLDPAQLAVDQVEQFIERTKDEQLIWTAAGVAAFRDDSRGVAAIDVGDPDKGHLWNPLFLPNGTELRMSYKGKVSYAQIRDDLPTMDGEKFGSISQWVKAVAAGTSRNAWLDVWVRRPGEREYRLANGLR
ncbi:hypothetical protein GR223_05255 [Rhizobium leguminosarum]|uniref:hypothetical protein n=1 Tax=Rhizobium TaxID=379 RepID=UPI00103B54AC|nr:MULTISPECIES: hypothetical protein [Rhizobium]NEJ85359.1 hypothetical protein [Rhizobium ruizarguesonis]TCA58073.1 hypothetical protein E0H71_00280 [Rhizobium leguminosarum bv. viciae]